MGEGVDVKSRGIGSSSPSPKDWLFHLPFLGDQFFPFPLPPGISSFLSYSPGNQSFLSHFPGNQFFPLPLPRELLLSSPTPPAISSFLSHSPRNQFFPLPLPRESVLSSPTPPGISSSLFPLPRIGSFIHPLPGIDSFLLPSSWSSNHRLVPTLRFVVASFPFCHLKYSTMVLFDANLINEKWSTARSKPSTKNLKR